MSQAKQRLTMGHKTPMQRRMVITNSAFEQNQDMAAPIFQKLPYEPEKTKKEFSKPMSTAKGRGLNTKKLTAMMQNKPIPYKPK